MESNNEPLGEDTVEEVIPVEFLPIVLCPFPFCVVAFLKSPMGFHGLGAPITGAKDRYVDLNQMGKNVNGFCVQFKFSVPTIAEERNTFRNSFQINYLH